MKTYAINLVTDTKHTDIYDKVALNKYPIVVICKTESELKGILTSQDTINFVKSLIKSQRLFNTAFWMIRTIYNNGDVREIVWRVSDMISIDYSQNNISNFEDNVVDEQMCSEKEISENKI